MHANAAPVLAIFEKKARLEVPLFQRQYVWKQEAHWQPLWDDIARKFAEHLIGRNEAPVHFLGAMVFDQKQTPTTHVERRQVIDGQQRLTTLQVFLAAFRDFARERECPEIADECDSFTLNKGMMPDPAVDKFKVWPTQLDRQTFTTVITAGARAGVEQAYPLHRRKYARNYDPRPRIVEAYLFFYDQLQQFFLGTQDDPPLAAETPLPNRLETCLTALKNSLRVVVIDLERDDDAQVIFETLNARGEPLLPADLLRNYIFLRAARVGANQEALYGQYWRRFDDPFWRQEVKQGRLLRPRSDLFIQHFLASKQTFDIPIKHLFVEYKHWIEHERPYTSIEEELAGIAREGEHFRRIIAPKKDDPLYPLLTFLDAYDIRTAYPLLLHLLNTDLAPQECEEIAVTLESYLLRRAVCAMTTKNYNRTFLTLTRMLRREGTTSARVREYLLSLTGESSEWPTDEKFAENWTSAHAYRILQNPKIVHILRRLNDTYLTTKHETILIDSPLTVEHILPQEWLDNWPLPGGAKGLTLVELSLALPDDLRAIATRRRNDALQTFGNLTIITQPLNASLSNSAWPIKKPALLNASLLPINQQLHAAEVWDEESIAARGRALFQRAQQLWPRSQSTAWRA
jgi:uncharacterized protein with ParB-like and HNH nuclease domain